jgi:DNA-binding PadR family transcriptional regulator
MASQGTDVTPQAAVLRVLVNGESEAAEIIRKVRDWTGGQIQFDDQTFASAIADLESKGLVERRAGIPDKQIGQARPGFTLTAAGRNAALEILAASLTRKA